MGELIALFVIAFISCLLTWLACRSFHALETHYLKLRCDKWDGLKEELYETRSERDKAQQECNQLRYQLNAANEKLLKARQVLCDDVAENLIRIIEDEMLESED